MHEVIGVISDDISTNPRNRVLDASLFLANKNTKVVSGRNQHVIDEVDDAIGRVYVRLCHVAVSVDTNAGVVHVQLDNIVMSVQCAEKLAIVKTNGILGVGDNVIFKDLREKIMVGRNSVDERLGKTSEGVVGRRKDGDTVCFQGVGDSCLLNQAEKSTDVGCVCYEVNDIASWRHHDLVDGMNDTVAGRAVERDNLRSLNGDLVDVAVDVEANALSVQCRDLKLVTCGALENATLYHVIL